MTPAAERPAWLDEVRADWEAWAEKRDAEHRRWVEEQRAESRRFMDELFTHNARINAEMIAGLHEFAAKISAESADQRAQIRANTQAVLRMLDRLGPEPA